MLKLRDLGVEVRIVNTAVAAEAGSRPLLTPRQTDVLRGIASGLSTKEIAHGLGISAKTVETHRLQIMKRLEIRTIPGLVRYALQHDVLPPSWLLECSS